MADLDLLQGTLDTLVLKTLSWGPRHGYAVARWIKETSDGSITVEDRALYVALHRLEERGWIEAQWGLSENNRKAKYYELTARGPPPTQTEVGRLHDLRERRLQDSPRRLSPTTPPPRRRNNSEESTMSNSEPPRPPRKLFHHFTTRASIQHEIDDELRFHLETRVEELVRAGRSPDEARRIALQEYGDVAAARAQLAQIDRRRIQRASVREWLSSWMQDLKFGVRSLRARPGFAATVILTLTLGIGANAAIFSVVDSVLLRSLPFTRPDRIVTLWETYRSNVDSRSEASYPDYLDWRARNHSFVDIGGYHGSGISFGAQSPVPLPAARSTANFFSVLGVRPALGRTFVQGEDAPDAPPVAILSYSFWQQQFAGDSGVVGRSITIDGKPATIVGVLPQDFEFAREGAAVMWLPINRFARAREQRGNHWLDAVARLRDGVTLGAAASDMSRIMVDLAREYPESNAGRDGQVIAVRDDLVGSVRPLVLLVYSAVAVMLLVACANVANLLLMRAADREREIAVRVALGAGRARLVRQLLTESMVLAAIAGTLGVLLARFGATALVGAVPARMRATIPSLGHANVDARVVVYSCVVSIVAGLLFGVVPALRGSRVHDALKVGSRGNTRGRRLRDLLVVAEVALTIVLMSGAALFGRSLAKLLSMSLGFTAEHVVTAGVLLPTAAYGPNDAARVTFFDRLMPAVRSLPGVKDAGMVTKLPLDWGNSTGFEIVGRPPSRPGEYPTASYRAASPDYFAALRIPVIEGRDFDEADRDKAPNVAIVNRAFANAYFGGKSPIGQGILLDTADTARIVGLVGDVPIGKIEDKIPPTLYLPFAQDAEIFMQIVVRTTGDPTAIGGSIARTVAGIDPRVAVTPAVTMDRLLSQSTSIFMRRFPLLLVGVFAIATLALALVGIYGVVSYAVASRTRELGVRLALGASPRAVATLVVRHGAWMAAAGVAIGLVAAALLGRFVSGMLYGISAHDPISYELVALLLGGAAIAATLLPARRAGRVDPATALRAE